MGPGERHIISQCVRRWELELVWLGHTEKCEEEVSERNRLSLIGEQVWFLAQLKSGGVVNSGYDY